MTKRTNNDLQNTTQRLKIEQHEPHYNPDMNSGYPEGHVVSSPLFAPVVLHNGIHITFTLSNYPL